MRSDNHTLPVLTPVLGVFQDQFGRIQVLIFGIPDQLNFTRGNLSQIEIQLWRCRINHDP